MQYSIIGPGTVARDQYGTIERKQHELWDELESHREGVSAGCGCYIFAVRAGTGMTPWYVGMAEKQSFRKECFTPHKQSIYVSIMNRYQIGTPILFLVARETPTGRLCQPSGNGLRDAEFLETLLISQALRANPNLANIKDTKLLKEMTVPGLLNGGQGKPTKSVSSFKRLLNL